MNKAFTREPERTADYCPRCGAKGEPVGAETLKHHLGEDLRGRISESASFCPSPSCDVVYFDALERIVLAAELSRPVYPKDLDAPICASFGLTRDDIEQDLREGGTRRIKAALEKAKSAAACCFRLAANGRSCAGYIRRYYMQRLSHPSR
jgi:hypothetical protein